ncbi:MAG: UDP-N-acetylglucosamine 2-epimerase (non-hydrolyzing) [Acidimicrobiaceae bacterium]|nr:UDP-N-acetylglucosamine 2-epimerase (non-hydrolyzing) [Acidimicrobiaceae bacterium]
MRAVVFIGTRPEAIKLAPVIRAMRGDPRWSLTVISTGQHREMLDHVLQDLGVECDEDLRLMTPDQTLSSLTAAVVVAASDVLARSGPDVVFVQGDTTTALACALASFYCKVPLAHVEAGLRSNDEWDPFPEEMNRRMVSVLATWHFTPTDSSSRNLQREGIDPTRIEVTGNTVVDSLEWIVAQGMGHSVFEGTGHKILVTLHRRENQGVRMREVSAALRTLGTRGDVEIVLPMHLSPSVRRVLVPELVNQPGIRIVEPLNYVDFVSSLRDAHVILTDSGGVQEEAPTFGKPVLLLRETTERPEGIAAHTALRVGTSAEVIVRQCERLLDDPSWYAHFANHGNPFGDGHATQRILDRLSQDLGRTTVIR